MKQIITGPYGRVAYHGATTGAQGQYPQLNLPCRAFARAHRMVAANVVHAPNVIAFARKAGTAFSAFDLPAKREV